MKKVVGKKKRALMSPGHFNRIPTNNSNIEGKRLGEKDSRTNTQGVTGGLTTLGMCVLCMYML